MSVTQVPQAGQPQVIDINELFRQKGELVTQFEIIQGRLQLINQQISGLVNQMQANQPPK